MAYRDIARVTLTGNLAKDLALRSTHERKPAATLRVACSARTKADGEWTEKTNYFDVEVFGALATNCERYLRKGSRVVIDGRLDYREWQDGERGETRSRVVIQASEVSFEGTPRAAHAEQSEDSCDAPQVAAEVWP